MYGDVIGVSKAEDEKTVETGELVRARQSDYHTTTGEIDGIRDRNDVDPPHARCQRDTTHHRARDPLGGRLLPNMAQTAIGEHCRRKDRHASHPFSRPDRQGTITHERYRMGHWRRSKKGRWTMLRETRKSVFPRAERTLRPSNSPQSLRPARRPSSSPQSLKQLLGLRNRLRVVGNQV